MRLDYLVRCVYWLGRMRAKAEADGDKIMMEMADNTADALADALGCELPPRPPAREEDLEELYG